MTNVPLEIQFRRLGERHQINELRALFNKTSVQELTATLKARLPRNDCNFWNYLLLGCDINSAEAREKRFACVLAFLNCLRSIELSYKETYELITRLCQDFNTYHINELGEVLEHCLDDIRAGDAKCVSWKDLLPEVFNLLTAKANLTLNGIAMRGQEFRESSLRNLYTMRWPISVLTPIADMFKVLQLTSAERLIVLNKFAGALQELSPMELPALCFQLFSMCSSAGDLIVPLLALEKYFHRNYYNRLFSDMCSNSTDLDSIEAYSEKELREAEETILYHLNYCTMNKLSEQQLSIMLRNFQYMPDVILTPFMLSAIISMTAVNREPSTARLTRSILLPLLRTVIKHNEEEQSLADYSVWCRDTLQHKQVDLQQVFTVLIDQNKDGKDVITPGLVNLAFVLLKAKKANNLNALSMIFLTKFIRKRFIFGQGIIERVAKWMVVEQDQKQYSECLTLFSVGDIYTVSECVSTIEKVMDNFLWLPGEQAMRMMTFILPLLKMSNALREALIEVLRKAINNSDLQTRRMGVFGFCMILKQLNYNNSMRSLPGASGYCTQLSVTGCSRMTQSFSNSRSSNHRNFNMLSLEIIDLLRICFDQPLDIRRTLYEYLQRAVELNIKLVPHVLQFIEWHFRSFFDTPAAVDSVEDLEPEFSLRYELLVNSSDEEHMALQLMDNLGCLVQFVSNCLVIFERAPSDYDTREMQRLLNLCIGRIVSNRLLQEQDSAPPTHLKCAIVQQQVNLIEGLMTHVLLSSKPENDHIRQMLPLFMQHQKLSQNWTTASKKMAKRTKTTKGDSNATAANLSVNGMPVKRLKSQLENIWELPVLEKLLHLLHDDQVPFANAVHTPPLRSNKPLVSYVLEQTALKVERIRLEPEYKQLAHSKRMLKQLTDIAKLVYERCICRLSALWRDFDMHSAELAAQCFMQCLRTANETYKKRFGEFTKGFDMAVLNKSKEAPYVLQDTIDEFMQEDFSKDAASCQLPFYLLQALEILYDHISFDKRATTESYAWLLKFCRSYELASLDLSLVHRLLFTQRQKTHAGAFFDGVARQLSNVLGTLNDNDDGSDDAPPPAEKFKSISRLNVEHCLLQLYAALHKQLEDVEYFIGKAKNLNYKCRIVAETDRDYWRGSLEALDRSICTQLIHISKALLVLTGITIPLGACMDGLMRLLILHYTCLANMTKHCLSCAANGTTSIKSTKIELLLRIVGKPLPTNFYKLIVYVEANVLDEQDPQSTKRKPQADKAKVLRETRLIPKVILAIEDFNKHTILLSKKTLDRLADYLHIGTVRDFRIKTAELKAAVERTFSYSNEIEAVESNLQDEKEDGDTIDEEASNDAACEVEAEREEQQSAPEDQPVKKARRRRVPSNEAEQSQPKRRRGRSAKK